MSTRKNVQRKRRLAKRVVMRGLRQQLQAAARRARDLSRQEMIALLERGVFETFGTLLTDDGRWFLGEDADSLFHTAAPNTLMETTAWSNTAAAPLTLEDLERTMQRLREETILLRPDLLPPVSSAQAEEIEGIRARLEAGERVTAGPWDFYADPRPGSEVGIIGLRNDLNFLRLWGRLPIIRQPDAFHCIRAAC